MTNLCPKCGSGDGRKNTSGVVNLEELLHVQGGWGCQLTAQVNQLRAENARLREAMAALLDVQNGPPLITWADAWNEAVDNAQAALDAAKGEN